MVINLSLAVYAVLDKNKKTNINLVETLSDFLKDKKQMANIVKLLMNKCSNLNLRSITVFNLQIYPQMLKLIADDTSLFSEVHNITVSSFDWNSG